MASVQKAPALAPAVGAGGPGLAAHLPSIETLLVGPGEGLFLLAPDLVVLHANAAGAAMAGAPPGRLVGRHIGEHVPAMAAPGSADAIRRVIESRTSRLVGPVPLDGVGEVELTIAPVPDGVLVLVRTVPVSGHEPAADRRFHDLFHNIPLGGAIYRFVRDESGEIVDLEIVELNDTGAEAIGIPADEAPGTSATARFGAAVMAEYLEIAREVARTGAPRALETHFGGRDYLSALFLIEDDLYANLNVDVTDRRRAEVAAAAAAARDALLVEESADGIFRVAPPRGRFLDVNPATCTLFGRSREELLGLDLLDLTRAHQVEELFVPPESADGSSATLERSILRADGTEILLSARFRALPDGSILVNARDMTRERALQAQVQVAQRMEAVGRLAGGIAHDFNNLLMAINGYAALIGENIDADDPLRPDIEAIRDAGERGALLTRQLLAFSRRQSLQPAAVEVGSIVQGLRPILMRLLGEEVTLYVRTSPDVGLVWADRAQIEQVIVNLVTNGRDAMPEGGALAIETTELSIAADDPRLQPPASPGRYVRLAVTDTGIGMDEDTVSRIFEPFFTTKRTGQGTGLGLSTVQGVVAQSGGFLSVESVLGRGTTFDVFLPVTDTPTGPAVREDDGTTAAPGGSETVLLVEDEPAVRSVMARMLRDLGYEVLEASGPSQAFAIAGVHPGRIDILVTDVVMPEMNGRRLAERLREISPDLGLFFVSGYSPDSVFRDGYLGDGAAFLHKPFTRAELAAGVRGVLDARKRRSSGSGGPDRE